VALLVAPGRNSTAFTLNLNSLAFTLSFDLGFAGGAPDDAASFPSLESFASFASFKATDSEASFALGVVSATASGLSFPVDGSTDLEAASAGTSTFSDTEGSKTFASLAAFGAACASAEAFVASLSALLVVTGCFGACLRGSCFAGGGDG